MDDYSIFIPPEIRKSRNLTPAQKLVLGALGILCKKHGFAWISNETLAQHLGMSKSTVKRSISSMKDMGILEIQLYTEENTTGRKIVLTRGVGSNLTWGGVKMNPGVGSKCTPNITSDNITSEYNTGNSSLSGQRPENLESVVHLFGQHNHPRREAESFYHYYESIGWVVGKNPVKNWVALAKKWMSKIKPSKTYKILT
jgi:DNA-binding Lrp family transcriptional regulator